MKRVLYILPVIFLSVIITDMVIDTPTNIPSFRGHRPSEINVWEYGGKYSLYVGYDNGSGSRSDGYSDREIDKIVSKYFRLPKFIQRAEAQQRFDTTLSPPTWILSGAAIDCDFANQRYWNCAPDQNFSITRASSGYAQDDSGIWRLFGNNQLRIGGGNGLLIEEARTNDALWSRDMTQAGTWVATTMTTALNATGIDGAANSATTLTATGANATILQTITLASQADTYSVWLKRVSGSGTINICEAVTACATTQACTVNSTSFTRCSITATLANPIVGIQIVTNGDSVIADFNQMEPGGFATSPILTTNATASRSIDAIVINPTLFGVLRSSAGSVFFLGAGSPQATTSSRMIAGDVSQFLSGAGNSTVRNVGSGVTLTATLGTGAISGSTKIALGWGNDGRSLVSNNGTLVTDTNLQSANTSLNLGNNVSDVTAYNGYIQRLTLWRSRLNNGILQGLTQ